MESSYGRQFQLDDLEHPMYRRTSLHVAVRDRLAIANAPKKGFGDVRDAKSACDGLR